MFRKICMILAAACIAASSTAEEPSPFVGNWSGEWDHKKGKGQLNELNILGVDAEGRITALYCFERPNGSGSFFQVKPGRIESSIDGNLLRFKHPWGKFKYTLTDDNTLRLRQSRKGKVLKMTMSRQEPSGCAAWIRPPTLE